MKKQIIYFLVLTASISSFAFEETYKETENFQIRVSKKFENQNNPRFCKFQTVFNKEKQVIELRMGVVGSPVAYFGWNAPIHISEFPLKSGFLKIFSNPGGTAMILSYDGKILSFKKAKKAQVWHRLYPFEIEIYSSLMNPKTFEAKLEGYEKDMFGRLQKHVAQKCVF